MTIDEEIVVGDGEKQVFANRDNTWTETIPPAFRQVVYLDFDGELTSYHNADLQLSIEDVVVGDSGLSRERIDAIVEMLNAKYAAWGVQFVAERPADGEFSTVYVGKTSAFEPYGNFAGLAESVDRGNRNKTDNAFVILDSTENDTAIVDAIAHETGHILGILDHGGEGLARYAWTETYHYYNSFWEEDPDLFRSLSSVKTTKYTYRHITPPSETNKLTLSAPITSGTKVEYNYGWYTTKPDEEFDIPSAKYSTKEQTLEMYCSANGVRAKEIIINGGKAN